MSVAEFAQHLDMAMHQPDLTSDDIKLGAERAGHAGVAAFYTNTCWTSTVAEILAGTKTRIGAAVGFPLGNSDTATKLSEVDNAIRLGATSVDMVANVGAWRSGDHDLVRREIESFVARCRDRALTKLIFEVWYLKDEEIGSLADLCIELGVDYIKTSTGPNVAPSEGQVAIMLERARGTRTRVKVSGVPRTFTLATVLWMLERGVDLIGTGKAPELVEQYATLSSSIDR